MEDFYIHSYSSSENIPAEGSWASLGPSAWQDLNLTMRQTACAYIWKTIPLCLLFGRPILTLEEEAFAFLCSYSCLEHSLTGPSIQLPHVSWRAAPLLQSHPSIIPSVQAISNRWRQRGHPALQCEDNRCWNRQTISIYPVLLDSSDHKISNFFVVVQENRIVCLAKT